ncbi:hypothetical protein ACFL2V_21090 [Pseudomonadota bacterium]
MKKSYIKLSLLIMVLISPYSSACELTEEYKKARLEVTKWARYEHQQCSKSVGTYYYWQEVAKCKEEGRGKNIGGGCQHVAGHTISKEPKGAREHCEILRVSSEERKEALEKYMKEENISMCVSESKGSGNSE